MEPRGRSALCACVCAVAVAACNGGTRRPAAVAVRTFTGACDASAAVALDARRLLIANDEDNVLRVYDATGGAAQRTVDLSPALGRRETDLEGGTVIGGVALWISSHGRSAKGKLRPERLRLFATTLADPPAVEGRVYTGLLDDLLADPRLAAFDLRAAAALTPTAPGGFNIEGLSATPDGRVLIGLRNPIRRGRALVVPLENPLEVIAGTAPARLGAPIALDLGGRGVRAIAHGRGRYVIAAGSATGADGLRPALYTWDGTGAPRVALDDLGGLNPEALLVADDRDEVLVVSDDGTVETGGVPCKRQPPERRRFRAAWLRLP